MFQIKRLDVITLFPQMFDAITQHTVISRAFKEQLVAFQAWQLRDFSDNEYGQVDDKPFGGGAGMVIQLPPVHKAILEIHHQQNIDVNKSTTVLLTPKGKPLRQKIIDELALIENIQFICPRYEGIDARIEQIMPITPISLGDFLISGGEIGAMAIIDALLRLHPQVIKKEAHIRESFQNNYLEHPHYTRPAEYMGHRVPEVLLSGDHPRIEKWRKEQSYKVTKQNRPDLLK